MRRRSRPARGDWPAAREAVAAGLAYMATLTPASPGVATTSFSTPASDGDGGIELRWYTRAGAAPGSALVYAHGGGMIGGSLDLYDKVVSWYVSQTGVPFLSVGYRLAPEAASTTSLAEDVFAGLTWLASHASGLGVDPARIAVMGDSGGGGPAAAAAILARDRDVLLARQVLIYPMLDDRTTTPGPSPDWPRPTRGRRPRHLPRRGHRLRRRPRLAGVPIELHVHPGAPRGFERFVPDAAVAQRAMADRTRAITAI